MLIDLRSDTVTLPTTEMRKAMYEAKVGDDVYGEDPTVRELEELGAEMTGKEAALFVASGTMGNQIAAMVHTQRGDEVICESECHMYYYEVAGLAYLAGVQTRTITGERGILSAEAVDRAIRGDDIHQPRTSLICLENTHNRAGGTYYTPDDIKAIKAIAKHHDIPVHIDGARIFNAAVAQNLAVEKIAKHADSVSFCLSKGLCAPVGSLLVGTSQFIQRARRIRKMLGGGMRQAGVLAAAGIVALKTMVTRLEEDHIHAKMLANQIANLGINIDMDTVKTNIVLFDVQSIGMSAEKFAFLLDEQGIKCSQFGDYKIRLVTHHGISKQNIESVIKVISNIVKGC
ncbi:MAG: low-specificity L-threonine aldolase [Veillonellaceae bacterium]|jgi:threonine aldolase|nr:low-specificity L-threonine aldolase [Veillonellaceae bacterium]